MIINNPETHAQLTAAFADYERALMENDIATLDALFWDSPHVLRYRVGENLHGIEIIRGFRKTRAGGSPRRVLRNTVITTFGTDFGTANTEFVRDNSTLVGRQSQVWVRLSQGWRITSAHVSIMARLLEGASRLLGHRRARRRVWRPAFPWLGCCSLRLTWARQSCP